MSLPIWEEELAFEVDERWLSFEITTTPVEMRRVEGRVGEDSIE